jgi:UDP-N-acetyl-D-glucosamine/UDP-N-acetyl-D-galactosamine dehydrogenase
LTDRERGLAIVGLGYVGLPVAVAFAKKFPGTIGYDVDKRSVESLAQCIDWTGEIDGRLIMESALKVTCRSAI